MFYIAPGKASGLFWKFSVLLCAGFLSVSCSLFNDSPDEDSPPPDQEESSDSSMPCDPVSGDSIGALQFEGTLSEEKIQVIVELEQLEDEDLQSCLQAVTKKEVIALTIWDLSRHTNPLLAEKAQALAERFDLASYVDGEIDSEDEERLQDITEFLLRIEPAQAKDILEQVSFETEEAGQIVETVSSGTARILIPTDSEGGDRYYVLASWDPADGDQINCLTKLFNKELSTQRTLEQEEQRMKELNGQRRVYWYSKEWALSLAESIEKCGAEANFVSGPGDPSAGPPVSDLSSEDEAASTSTTETDSNSGEQASPTPKTDSDSADERVQKRRKRRRSEGASGSPSSERKRRGSETVPDTSSAGEAGSDTGDSADSAPADAVSMPKAAEDASADGSASVSGTVSDSSPEASASASGSASDSSSDESTSDSGKSPASVTVQKSSTSVAGTARIKVFVDSQIVEERVIPLDGSSSPQPVPESQTAEGVSAVTEEPKGSDKDILKEWDDNGNGWISCREAEKHGTVPIQKDHPAYPFMKDRNKDGVVCD